MPVLGISHCFLRLKNKLTWPYGGEGGWGGGFFMNFFHCLTILTVTITLQVYEYNPADETWSDIATMEMGRYKHAVAEVNLVAFCAVVGIISSNHHTTKTILPNDS